MNPAAPDTNPGRNESRSALRVDMLAAEVHWVGSREEREPTALAFTSRLNRDEQQLKMPGREPTWPRGAGTYGVYPLVFVVRKQSHVVEVFL